MSVRPPDWQLPLGVTPALWEYLHQPEVAGRYDAYLQGSDVIAVDGPFLARHFHAGQTVLDLGCGTGRTLTQLAHMGCRVIGLDLSTPMLQKASQAMANQPHAIGLVQANLVDLGCIETASVDGVVCLFSTLGLIHPHQARQQVLNEAYRVLKPKGRFVLHAHSRTYNVWIRQTRGWWLRDLGSSWLVKGYEAGNWVMPHFHGVSGLIMHLFTPREVSRMLQQAHFRLTDWQWLGLGPSGCLRHSWFLPGLRAHGFLIAAEKFA